MNKKPIDLFIEQNGHMIEYISKLDKTLEKINDQNILHAQTIQKNTEMGCELASAIKYSNKTFRWIMMVLVLAIVCLAGAEKILQFIPLM